MALRKMVSLGLAVAASAQKVGHNSEEVQPELPLWECTASGCVKEEHKVTMDANWRWIHNGQYTNCYTDSKWDADLCPDPGTCAANCHLDGIDTYDTTYGVEQEPTGIELNFVTKTDGRANYGSRLYLMEDDSSYKLFHLKNKEFTMTVDVSRLPCGLNGAVYFVEMDADGGMAKSGGKNAAGAKYGTGYCDAQCPHDIKFIDGESNSDEWNSTSNPPVGKYGACCAELDIWEANSRATAYTPHTCSKPGAYRCSGVECGDNEADERYDGVCDKDGCDFNSYRMGDTTFYGRKDTDAVNTREPLTVVTQFITNDGTDTGDLTEIRRLYVQSGDIIYNSNSTVPGVHGNSITDEFCREVKQAFGDVDDFGKKGGLKAMGEALDRGMVLVLSLWDDSLANMLWLDSKFPANESEAKLGVMRGPCSTTTGTPEHVRANFPHASVKFYDVKVGALDTTYGAGGGGIDDGDDEFGRDRRLGGVFV